MIKVSRLRCEYLINPFGMDENRPRLSWVIESGRRGTYQTAWRVRVASSLEVLESGQVDLWDSGRVEDGRSSHIVYEGKPLTSRQRCYWKVEVCDDKGNTFVSETAHWTMGLLDESDWRADWISANPDYLERCDHAIKPTITEPGTPPWFRKVFTVKDSIRRATVYGSARGILELSLNGQRVGDNFFSPEWTDYDKRIHYHAYDVTEMVSTGENVLGAILGDGWYSGYVGWQETRGRYGLENSLTVQLEITLYDGSTQIVASDKSWKCSAGPIISSDFMMGETYDARCELTGWDKADFDDAKWCDVNVVSPPDADIVSQRSEPVRIVETIKPVSVNEISPGVWIYDLGQNISGWVKLKVSGQAGMRITLRHGERLNPDGTLYTENLRRAKATDIYILKGQGEEIRQPRFTFHGFQYVELTGPDLKPADDAVTGCVIHSSTPKAGTFDCSDRRINRLWLNGVWSQKDNFISVPTDCPQRDERLGWTGDAQVFSRTAGYNMDVAAFFTKWMIDVCDAQTPEGIFPDTAPRLKEGENFVGLDGLGGAAGWADAGIIIPWMLWRVYDDTRIVERHFQAMCGWLDYIQRTNPNGIRCNQLGNNYGDWLCIPSDTTFRTQSPMKTLLATAYWADDAAKLSKMARAIGKAEQAEKFEKMFEYVRDAFQKEFLLDGGRLSVDTQTAYILALAFDLLPEKIRQNAAEHLIDNIKQLDWHLSTGFIGISHLNPTLTAIGRSDVAWRLLLNEDYPSWLYPVLHGATTIWERWNGWTHQDGFFNPQMNSFNHYSLGSVGEWLYRCAAGIEPAPEVNGFKKIKLCPYPGGGLKYAGAEYDSIYGLIKSRWQRDGDRLTYEITVPANTSACVYIPSDTGTPITESGRPVEDIAGIEPAGRQEQFAVFEIPSGSYKFTSTYTG